MRIRSFAMLFDWRHAVGFSLNQLVQKMSVAHPLLYHDEFDVFEYAIDYFVRLFSI